MVGLQEGHVERVMETSELGGELNLVGDGTHSFDNPEGANPLRRELPCKGWRKGEVVRG